MVRGPDEAADVRLKQFYDRLLAVLRHSVFRNDQWQLLECVPAWDGNWTWDCFLVFAWQGAGDERLLLTVNYAPNQSQCHVRLPFTDLGISQCRLKDLLGDATYDRDGNDLESRGLYLDVPPWKAHVFLLTKVKERREARYLKPKNQLPLRGVRFQVSAETVMERHRERGVRYNSFC